MITNRTSSCFSNLERALVLLCQTGYVSAVRCLSVSRFNWQLHRNSDFLDFCLQAPLEVAAVLSAAGVRLAPIQRANMQPYGWAAEYDLRLYRKSIETVNSQLASTGLQHLRAHTNEGFTIKVQAALIALRHNRMLAS